MSACALAPSLGAQSFAPPVRLVVGESFLGQSRLYPSPVGYDFDGDGLMDLVIGDLAGRLTVAKREAAVGLRFAADVPVQAADGTAIKFDNW